MTTLLRQVRWEQKQFWRNPPAAVFTFVFPLMLLFIFSVLFSNERDNNLPGNPKFVQVYVPAIVGFGLISACYTNLGFTLCLRREQGILKRKRGTPLSATQYIGGMIGNVLIISVILSVITIVVGVMVFGITFPHVGERLLTLIIVLLAGAFCFSAWGVAISTLVPNEEAAPAIINIVLFPLLFISGTFARVKPDSGVDRVAQLFPIRHLNKALEAIFRQDTTGEAWRPRYLLALFGWGAAGIVVSLARFRWEPRAGTTTRAGRRGRSRTQATA